MTRHHEFQSEVDQAGATQVDDDLPSPFGRFRIIKRLGQGGMGVVYLAHDTETDRRVALKLPHAQFEQSADDIARFSSARPAAATSEHPNFCRIHDVGRIDGPLYCDVLHRRPPLGVAHQFRAPLRAGRRLLARLTPGNGPGRGPPAWDHPPRSQAVECDDRLSR